MNDHVYQVDCAIDPGFDLLALAVFEYNTEVPTPADFGSRLGLLWKTEEIVTDAQAPLFERVEHIAWALQRKLLEFDVDRVFLELPSKPGAYKRNRGLSLAMADGMRKLHLAIGAVVAVCSYLGVDVVPVSSGVPKAERQAMLKNAAKLEGVELPTGPRGGVRHDLWDAIYLGVCNVGR